MSRTVLVYHHCCCILLEKYELAACFLAQTDGVLMCESQLFVIVEGDSPQLCIHKHAAISTLQLPIYICFRAGEELHWYFSEETLLCQGYDDKREALTEGRFHSIFIEGL